MLIDIKHWPKKMAQIAHGTSDIRRVSKKGKKKKEKQPSSPFVEEKFGLAWLSDIASPCQWYSPVWDTGISKKGFWVQTHWCAGESADSPCFFCHGA